MAVSVYGRQTLSARPTRGRWAGRIDLSSAQECHTRYPIRPSTYWLPSIRNRRPHDDVVGARVSVQHGLQRGQRDHERRGGLLLAELAKCAYVARGTSRPVPVPANVERADEAGRSATAQRVSLPDARPVVELRTAGGPESHSRSHSEKSRTESPGPGRVRAVHSSTPSRSFDNSCWNTSRDQ